MSQVYDLASQLSMTFKSDPSLLSKITTKLLQLTIKAGSDCNNKLKESYCYKFSVPKNQVEQLYKELDLDKRDVRNKFYSDWKYKANSHMWENPYYHILFLLFMVGIIDDNKTLKNKSLILAMIQLWNGRMNTFFPKCCIPEVMNYVINNMCTGRYVAKKYSTPYDLIENYFVPTILKKYESYIKRDPKHLKTVFSASYTRIRQLFVQGNIENMKTGKKEATSGLMALYRDAIKDQRYLKSKDVTGFGDNDPTFDEFGSTNVREKMATDITTYITMNGNPKYSSRLINDLNKKYKVKLQVIEDILKSLHTNQFYDDLYSVYIIFFSRCNINDPNQICNGELDTQINKHVIRSKNNSDINSMNKIIYNILTNILNKYNLNFGKFTNTYKINARNVVIWGLIHNMKKKICNI
jgi:hypothetical protein